MIELRGLFRVLICMCFVVVVCVCFWFVFRMCCSQEIVCVPLCPSLSILRPKVSVCCL